MDSIDRMSMKTRTSGHDAGVNAMNFAPVRSSWTAFDREEPEPSAWALFLLGVFGLLCFFA